MKEILKTGAVWTALTLLSGAFLHACLVAHEQEECARVQRQADAGYPVNVPAYCRE